MTQLCRKIVQVNLRLSLAEKVTVFRRFFKFIWHRILACSIRPPAASSRYTRLSSRRNSSPSSMAALEYPGCDPSTTSCSGDDPDLVCLKISLLGDCRIGKTSFAIRYVGDLQEQKSLQMKGLNLMDKTFDVGGAKIACRIWDVGGDRRSLDQVPIACKDAVAILFMFDLTSRCTLNSIIGWYSEARKWNQTAIPILIGTKFDDFVQMPPDIQWTVITQPAAVCLAAGSHSYLSLKFNEIALPYPPRRCSIAFSCTIGQSAAVTVDPVVWQRPDSFGRFGKFGGKYVPETLMYALTELEAAFKSLATDDDFQKGLNGN